MKKRATLKIIILWIYKNVLNRFRMFSSSRAVGVNNRIKILTWKSGTEKEREKEKERTSSIFDWMREKRERERARFPAFVRNRSINN